MNILYFDIETAGRTDALDFAPEFSAPSNYSDPAKISAAIEKAKAEWFDKAALDPMTGEIVAFSYAWNDGDAFVKHSEQESDILQTIESVFYQALLEGYYICGYNIKGFDLPYIIKRCAVHGVKLTNLIDLRRSRPYWLNNIIDVLEVWTLGGITKGQSLSNVSKLLGMGEKIANGKYFAQLIKESPELAIQYAKEDVTRCREVFKRIKPACLL